MSVNVEPGAVTGKVGNNAAAAAQGLANGVANYANKAGSGMSLQKAGTSKTGVQINVVVVALIDKGNGNFECTVLADFKELPKKERLTIDGIAKATATGAGVTGAVSAAVEKLMDQAAQSITGSSGAQVVVGKAPLIYMAPFTVNYMSQAPSAAVLVQNAAKAAVLAAADKRVQKNPKRFTQDAKKFTVGSGMPAYGMGLDIKALTYDATKREAVATIGFSLYKHPGKSMIGLTTDANAKAMGQMKPPTDAEKAQLWSDAAANAVDKTLDKLLKLHP
jgi:hypothetical protein